MCSKSTFPVSLSISNIGKSVIQHIAISSLFARLYLSLRASLTALSDFATCLDSHAQKNIISPAFGCNLSAIALISLSEKNLRIGLLGHSAS